MLKSRFSAFAGAVALALSLLTGGAAAAETDAKAADTTAEALKNIPCAACHADLTKKYLTGRHGGTIDARAPGANCSTCHGEVLRHMANPMKEKPQVTFKKDVKGFMTPEAQKAADAACTSCHKDASQTHWAQSTHAENGVACVTCHNNHKPDVATRKETSTALCLSCHAEKKADLFKHSGHPLLDGQMNCVSCHNPHGDKPAGEGLLKEGTVNETCFACHPGKRGPFLFNHEPVTEDCTLCHAPHGSNKSPMLNLRDPQLCQSCHPASHHDMAEKKRQGCTSCHGRIHGSNSPFGNAFLE